MVEHSPDEHADEHPHEREEQDDAESINRRIWWLKQRLGLDHQEILRRTQAFRKSEKSFTALSRFVHDLGPPSTGLDVDVVPSQEGQAKNITIRPVHTSSFLNSWTSWGLSGISAELSSDAPFSFATIRIRIPPNVSAHFIHSSLMVARWEAASEEFFIIPASGFNSAQNYAFFQATRGGLYTVVGIPKPMKQRALLVGLSLIRQSMRHDDKVGRAEFAEFAFEAIPSLARELTEPSTDEPLAQPRPRHILAEVVEIYSRPDRDKYSISELMNRLDKMPELQLIAGVNDPSSLLLDDEHFPEIWPNKPYRPQFLGPPNFAGRITSIVCDPHLSGWWYAGTAGGGVWRTIDSGATWKPTMDQGGVECLAIGGIAISSSDPPILYAATGEWTGGVGVGLSIVGPGAGVYRSPDRGATWQPCAPLPAALKYCSILTLDPNDNAHVYVGGDSGLYHSFRCGQSWDEIEVAGQPARDISDLVLDPDEPGTIIVAIHYRGVFRRRQGDLGWTSLAFGDSYSPANLWAPSIAIRPVKFEMENRLLAKIGAQIFEYDERLGFSPLTTTRGHMDFRQYSWASFLSIHPNDASLIIAGDLECEIFDCQWQRTTTLTGANLGVDQQDIAFLPGLPAEFLIANDRGLHRISLSRGENEFITAQSHYVAKQIVASHFYSVTTTPFPHQHIVGTMQDADAHLLRKDGSSIPFTLGEGGFASFVPGRENSLLHASFKNTNLHFVTITESSTVSTTRLDIKPDITLAEPIAFSAQGPGQTLAIVVARRSPSDGITPTQSELVQFRPANGDDDWSTSFSGDWPIVKRTSPGIRLSSVVLGRGKSESAYVSTLGGQIYISRNICNETRLREEWDLLVPDNLAAAPKKIRSLFVDWHTDQIVLACGEDQQDRPTLFRGQIDLTGDRPKITWTQLFYRALQPPLPGLPIISVISHPKIDGLIFASSTAGLLLSRNSGQQWELAQFLPPVAILDLDIEIRPYQTILVAATMGRGIVELTV